MAEEFTERSMSERYRDIAPLNEKHGVYLVRDEDAGRMCVKKILKTYNPDVYERVRSSNIKGLPEIYHMEENDGELTVIEEYISGETVDSILKNKGAIPEDQVQGIAVKLCGILITGKALGWKQDSRELSYFGSLLDNMEHNSENDLLTDSREESDKQYLERIKKDFRKES